MMMLNVRTTFSSIFGILFILSISFTAFAQQEQQVGAALSQSQFMQILDKIDESEDEMRSHVDKKFDELDEKFDKLDEKVDGIKTDVAVLNARLNLLQWVIAIIGAPFLISIIVLFVQMRLNQRNSAEITSEVPAESKEESDEDIRRGNLIDNQQSETEIA
jgi:predicted PurR-regulated permease PerM